MVLEGGVCVDGSDASGSRNRGVERGALESCLYTGDGIQTANDDWLLTGSINILL